MRIINLAICPTYLDETGFMINNNNYYRWIQKNNKDFNVGPKKNNKERVNLLLAVTSEKIINYKLIKENTNGENFVLFLKELFDTILKNEKNKYIIIMDNSTQIKQMNL